MTLLRTVAPSAEAHDDEATFEQNAPTTPMRDEATIVRADDVADENESEADTRLDPGRNE